jgi:hypothetical protein
MHSTILIHRAEWACMHAYIHVCTVYLALTCQSDSRQCLSLNLCTRRMTMFQATFLPMKPFACLLVTDELNSVSSLTGNGRCDLRVLLYICIFILPVCSDIYTYRDSQKLLGPLLCRQRILQDQVWGVRSGWAR